MSLSERWIGLELRHLTALRAIADEGSFRGAAGVLGYTPSAVSQQIATLERIVGTKVVDRGRGRRTLELTEAGHTLLVHLSAIEARLAVAKADIEGRRGAAGPLCVGACESVGSRLLPEVISRFRRAFPDTEIDVSDALFEPDLFASLERGALDLAFGVLPLPERPFNATVIANDPWVLVVRKGSERAELAAPQSLREIGQLSLVTLRSQAAMAPALDQLLAAGIEPKVTLRSDYNAVVQGFAAAGLGVALMPRFAVNPHDERTVTIEVGALISPRQIAIVRHRDRSPSEAQSAFSSLAAQVGSELWADSHARARLAVTGGGRA
jgi:DNA-binding transcriptional LysR family regulator